MARRMANPYLNLIFPYHVHMDPTAERPATHEHPFHEFFLLLDGAGWQVTDGADQPMRPGDLFLFPAGGPHIGWAANDRTEAVVINVGGEAFAAANEGEREMQRALQAMAKWRRGGANGIGLSAADRRRTRSLSRAMVDEQVTKPPGYRAAVKTHLQELLLIVLRGGGMPAEVMQELRADGREDRLADVLHYLSSAYTDPISVERVARMAHMSRSAFHKLFREVTGRTLVEYVNDRRVEQAVRMLVEGRLPIVQVAAACGFPCLSHFYHEFKRRTGATPREARARGEGA